MVQSQEIGILFLEEMKKIPAFNKRSTFRSLSFATDIPVSTLHYLKKNRKLKEFQALLNH